ncbi:MAG: hypothetical protein JKY65_11710 [Planctomycetes bacterium]|nr:hypothetical protein [Planctomycetota bacterium]
MSTSPKILKGASGTVSEQITAGVIHKFWSRSRVAWGKEVTLGALISGYADGTAVKLIVYEDDGAPEDDDFVTELDGKIDKGLATAIYTVDFEDPDDDEGDEYELYFLVEIAGEIVSDKEQCPYLLVDLTLPMFSE